MEKNNKGKEILKLFKKRGIFFFEHTSLSTT